MIETLKKSVKTNKTLFCREKCMHIWPTSRLCTVIPCKSMTGKFPLRLFNLNATGETYTEITRCECATATRLMTMKWEQTTITIFPSFLCSQAKTICTGFSLTQTRRKPKSPKPHKKRSHLPAEKAKTSQFLPLQLSCQQVAWDLLPPLSHLPRGPPAAPVTDQIATAHAKPSTSAAQLENTTDKKK